MNEVTFDDKISRHSTLTFFSFAFYQFPASLVTTAQTVVLFFFYEAVIGLNTWLVFLGFTIATIWDAINDPLLGFLTDRNIRLTKRLGRRFPWILFGVIPWSFSLLFIYMPPPLDPVSQGWLLTLWLIFALCFFDTFHTLIYVQIVALRADKFRTEEERRRLSQFFVPIDAISSVTGSILPPLFLGLGEGNEGFAIMAILISIITLASSFIFLPGTKEDEIMIKRYFEQEFKRMGFFTGLRELFKSKAFIVFILTFIFFEITMGMLTGNTIYLATFALRDSDLTTVILLVFLLAAIISVPFWTKLMKKWDNNKKVFQIGGFATCLALIPITFFVTLVDLLIFTFILGFMLGSMWALLLPVIQPNVLDDFVIQTKKDQKGVLIGITTFIVRFSATIDELILTIVHNLTGFLPGYDTYEKMAAVVGDMTPVVWGIRCLMGVIPALILFIGIFIFWKFYPLTQDKVHQNKLILEELKF
ncbi:MAG: MFS transporter [Promethearchaeota archaeon]